MMLVMIPISRITNGGLRSFTGGLLELEIRRIPSQWYGMRLVSGEGVSDRSPFRQEVPNGWLRRKVLALLEVLSLPGCGRTVLSYTQPHRSNVALRGTEVSEPEKVLQFRDVRVI